MWIIIFFTILAGFVLPIQFSINSQLRNFIGSPYLASTISFLIGAASLTIISLLKWDIKFDRTVIHAPWWVWLGGILGAFYILITIIVTPKLGSANTVAFVLTGQIIASVLIDHFGLLNIPQHPLNTFRIMGILLIILGVYLVMKF